MIILFLMLGPGNLLAQTLISLNFEGDEVGKFPLGWSAWDQENMLKIYRVQSEGGNKFLRADSRGTIIQIGYEKNWALKDFPMLRWR